VFVTFVPENKRIRRSFRAVEGDWRRADLHLHTPASADWLEPGVTYLQWLQKAESKGLDIVAITDHNTVEGVARMRAEVERLAWLEANDRLRPQERRDLDEYRRLGDKILVLPGFEFTATFGFHILGIFPPETSLRKLELLLLRLNLPVDRLGEGAMDVGPTTDVLTAYRLIREAGGLVIAAHANSTHGVALQGMSFGGQTRIAFTQDASLHALEVTDMESISRRASARFFDGSKPEYPRRMHVIQGSDAHRLTRDPRDKNRLGVGDRVTEVLLPEVSFDALRTVFEADDFTSLRPYRPPAEVPFDHVQAALEQGPNIIQSFHEGLSRSDGRLQKVLCDVVAFANTCGGTVYIGAVPGRRAAGHGADIAEAEVAQLRKEIERNITPPIDATVDTLTSLGAPVVRVRVPNGAEKPYALGQTRVYVRAEGDTNEAVRDELVQLVLAGQRGDVAAAQPVEPEEAPAVPVEPRTPASVPARSRPAVAPAGPPMLASDAPEPVRLPAIGVEIASMEERKGNRYFTIRDLRNGNVVQNVTMHSARKLWSYAINQFLTNAVDPSKVTWREDLGLLQAARRAKKLRYDLVLRQPDGSLRVFYGVTADGMVGPWSQFLLAEDRPEGDAAAVLPSTAIIDLPEDEPLLETTREDDILAPEDEENGVLADAKDEAAAAKRRRRGGRGRGRGKGQGAEPAAATPDAQLPEGVPEPLPPDTGNGRGEPLPRPPFALPAPQTPEVPEMPADTPPADAQEEAPAAAAEVPAPPKKAPRRSRSKPKAEAAVVEATGLPEPELVAPAPEPPVEPAPAPEVAPAADAVQEVPKPKRTRARKPKAAEGEVPAAKPVPAAPAAGNDEPQKQPGKRASKKTANPPWLEPLPPLKPQAASKPQPKPRTPRKKSGEV
jgi:hypothetical protein